MSTPFRWAKAHPTRLQPILQLPDLLSYLASWLRFSQIAQNTLQNDPTLLVWYFCGAEQLHQEFKIQPRGVKSGMRVCSQQQTFFRPRKPPYAICRNSNVEPADFP